jgi:hypothetical protein
MRRLTDPAYPRELRLVVIEAATEIKSLQWWPSKHHTLDLLANSFFLKPPGVGSDTRAILRQTVASVLLKAFFTALLLRGTTQDTLMTPLSLNGSSVHVRRLVVHLPPTFLTAHEDLHGCNESVRRMELLKLSFPRLEICICVIPIASFWSVLRKLSQTKADAAKKRIGAGHCCVFGIRIRKEARSLQCHWSFDGIRPSRSIEWCESEAGHWRDGR